MLIVAAMSRGNSRYAKRATMRIKRLELRMSTRDINLAHAYSSLQILRHNFIKNKIEHKN